MTNSKVAVDRSDEAELRRMIIALSGVFATLSWLEVDAVDSCIAESEKDNAVGCLVLAWRAAVQSAHRPYLTAQPRRKSGAAKGAWRRRRETAGSGYGEEAAAKKA
ncbi:MAG: hypothetical protein U1E60_06620 [Reyranellaceae bacterium]